MVTMKPMSRMQLALLLNAVSFAANLTVALLSRNDFRWICAFVAGANLGSCIALAVAMWQDYVDAQLDAKIGSRLMNRGPASTP